MNHKFQLNQALGREFPSTAALNELNQNLESQTPEQRVEWALQNLPANFMLSSSFGAQAAVMLHLVTQQYPDIPVVLTDTGYLFDETYQFIDELTDRLKLNLQVYRSTISPAWQEAKMGKMWEQGLEGIEKYNTLNKVEPMQAALKDLDVKTWFAGLRRSQSDMRENLPVVQQLKNQIKVYPIINWSNRDVHMYLKKHNLPYHPLWEKGYVSIGDWHSTRSLEEGMNEQDTRFSGLKRECGLHEFGDGI
ncbi:phosphoadenylyl-sulfate reductase [Paraglaciecola aquimarina]|uniref:Phosphoadenosine 5'-phosphosulfate reductase n=1 Tax=Paraglaciecola algarum TaxID=3050085 RepID=A0ABS9D3W9_9ALTE|nr:phosphoadenylyl-sulfate reductase [Paraglaciecola sp. G1-23]MCF2947329.1 phosphoadenylyl-sulfate reductase [Paraglaciecola sp. G1-23]